jgi:acetyltransferase-like isoleucine patch superfamily enzyme
MNIFYKVFQAVAIIFNNNISVWKTVYFNFHYFPFTVASKLPIILYKGVKFNKTKGRIILDSLPIKTGMVGIGKKTYGFVKRQDYTIWEQYDGTVFFESGVNIGKGTFVHVGNDAILKVGQDTRFGGNARIICDKSITIKAHSKVAWDVQLCDTDFRATINTITKAKNCFKREIIIGSHNWLCFGSTILKGSITPDYCIVGANTTINKDFSKEGENIVIGMDSNAKVLAKYISWDSNRDTEE